MSSLKNENYAFNEMMVHVPLCTHKQPKKILVIGQSDDDFKKELLKHNIEDIKYTTTLSDNTENTKEFDVVIVTEEKLNQQLLENIYIILKEDGVLAFKSTSYSQDTHSLINDLTLVGSKFWIAMPFKFNHTTSILASKKYHPTADIILQVSDLLSDLNYYSTEIHHSSFVFPANIQRDLTGIAKR